MADKINKRPNIRIEIQNKMCESMDVDESEELQLFDGEEGEILEETRDFDDFVDNITYPKRPSTDAPAKNACFVTGINIFNADEQAKQKERAERFGLEAKDVSSVNGADLQHLHDSLGICAENEKEMRFAAVHMHGTNEMSTKDVLSYFAKYSPNAIEWISDECCNVTWSDVITPARALLHLSTVVRGMPVEGPRDPFATKSTKGRSILLKTEELLSIADISVPVPPGYWRLGVSHPKSKCILLRYALKTDKKPFKAEKFSEYYKRHGNPNYGGLKGIISESKKAQFKGILERNKEIKGKNPWGDLAMTWNDDRKREEIIVPIVDDSNASDVSLKHRLGFKRKQQSLDTDEPKEKPKIPRMRMYADEEEERLKRKRTLQQFASGTSSHSKGNDLRAMINRKNCIQTSKSSSNDEDEADFERLHADTTTTSSDLGAKLMNRKLKFEKSDVNERRMNASSHQSSKHHRFRSDCIRHKRYKSPPPPFHSDEEHDDDDYEANDDGRTNSKVTVVVKQRKQPAVASTVWSRVNTRNNHPADDDSATSSSEESSEDEDQITPSFVNRRPGFKRTLAADFPISQQRKKSPLRIEINNDHFRK